MQHNVESVNRNTMLGSMNEGPRNLLSGRGKAQLFLHSIPLPATKAMYLHIYAAAEAAGRMVCKATTNSDL
jgi:hypothetical protein